MAEQKNPQAQPELSLSEQTRIRREKLTNLQAEGQNPFVITRFDWDATSQQIKDNFDAMEGKPVKVAGRLMSKRGSSKLLKSLLMPMFCSMCSAVMREVPSGRKVISLSISLAIFAMSAPR